MENPPFPILYEDNHLLVVDKPAGLPTMGVADDRATVLSEAKAYIKSKYGKPGNVYLGIVSRLDAPVTGALVIARTSKAASRLTEQFQNRDVVKCYWALVQSPPVPKTGVWEDFVRKDERHRKMHVTHAQHPEAKLARLRYTTIDQVRAATLLEIHLETGRKHQIRLQLVHRGHPVFGDRKYGSEIVFPKGIGLHSRRVEFEHPVRKSPLSIECRLPESWAKFVSVV